jgi:hypothetical protein
MLTLRGKDECRGRHAKAGRNPLGSHDMYENKGVRKIGEISPNPYLIQCKGLHKSSGFVEATMCMKTQGLRQN